MADEQIKIGGLKGWPQSNTAPAVPAGINGAMPVQESAIEGPVITNGASSVNGAKSGDSPAAPTSPTLPSANGSAAGADEEKPVDTSTFALGGKNTKKENLGLLEKLLAQKKDAKNGEAAPSSENIFGELIAGNSPQQQAQTAGPSIAQLLGPKPIITHASIEEARRKKEKMAKNVLAVVGFLALAVYGFFYSQLEPSFTLLNSQFGPNVGSKFVQSNAEIMKMQTDLNVIRFRTARLLLDELNGLADSYARQVSILASSGIGKNEKGLAQGEADRQAEILDAKLAEVRKIFSRPLGVDVFSTIPVTPEERETRFEEMLKNALSQEKQAISGNESRSIGAIEKLVENKAFRTLVKSRSSVKMSHDERVAFLNTLRLQSGDEFSAIEKIKSQRIVWSRLLNDIHSVVRKADIYYGQGLFKTVGGFVFTSYRFDSKTNRIGLSGVTKTSDSKTFSFITKLIDSVEKSPKFKDIDFRSFTKSRDETGDFSSSLNVDFSLQDGPDARDDAVQTL